MGNKFWLRLIGSVILILMGLRLYTCQRRDIKHPGEDFGSLQLALLNFTLVLSNPLTLGFYLAAFAMLGLRTTHLWAGQSFALGGGIAFGAMVWFALISIAAGRFHHRVSDVFLGRVRVGIGILFIILGLVSAVSLFMAR